MKICVMHPRLAEKIAAAIADKLPEVEAVAISDIKSIPANADSFEILIAPNQIPAGLFEKMTRLKWVQLTSSGHDHLLSGGSHEHLTVTSAGNIVAQAVAEYVLTWILAVSKCVPQVLLQRQDKKWQLPPSDIVSGKKLVVIGYGNIGKEIVLLSKPFGFDITVVSRKIYSIEGVKSYSSNRLSEAAKGANILVAAVPLENATKHLVSEQVLRSLAPMATVINVSRYQVFDHHALIHALIEKRIQSAVIDTFDVEPLPADRLEWSIEGLYVTPHYAFFSPKHESKIIQLIIDNCSLYLDHKPLLNVCLFPVPKSA